MGDDGGVVLWGELPPAARPGQVRYWYDWNFDLVRRVTVNAVDAAGLASVYEAETRYQFFVPAPRLRADRDGAAGDALRAACLRVAGDYRTDPAPAAADIQAAALLATLVAEAHAGCWGAARLAAALDRVRDVLAACAGTLARRRLELGVAPEDEGGGAAT